MKALLSTLLLLLAVPALHAQQAAVNYRKPGAAVPSFRLNRPAGGTVTNKVLRPGRPFMFLIFSPQCDHCAEALDSLRSVPELQPETDLVLVVEARNKPYLKAFMTKHRFDTVSQFRNIGFDSGRLIANIYNYGMLPQFSIYNNKHRFVRSFSGIFPLDSLRPYLRQGK